jgi:hypothetical protein
MGLLDSMARADRDAVGGLEGDGGDWGGAYLRGQLDQIAGIGSSFESLMTIDGFEPKDFATCPFGLCLFFALYQGHIHRI